jgi:hypothetical protein
MRKVAHLAATNTILLFLIFFPLTTMKAQELRSSANPTPPIIIDAPIRPPTLDLTHKLTGSISGVVRTPTGEIVPGVKVSIRNKNDGRKKTATTDSKGGFKITGLVPGPYHLIVIQAGFSGSGQEIVLGENQGATVNFDDVPIAAPKPAGGGGGSSGGGGSQGGTGGGYKPPAIDKRTLEIYTQTFDRDIELAKWLQAKKADRQRLSNIIYVKDKTSLFIMEPLKKGVDLKYTVTPPINEALDPYNVLLRIKQNSGKTFIGIHRISDNSYLMVFHD